jgi:hypothetical protein
VTAKVTTSVESVVGEKNSLYFLKSAVKILDFKQRKQNNLEDEDIESGSDNDEDDIIPTYVEYEEYKNDERLKAVIINVSGKNYSGNVKCTYILLSTYSKICYKMAWDT